MSNNERARARYYLLHLYEEIPMKKIIVLVLFMLMNNLACFKSYAMDGNSNNASQQQTVSRLRQCYNSMKNKIYNLAPSKKTVVFMSVLTMIAGINIALLSQKINESEGCFNGNSDIAPEAADYMMTLMKNWCNDFMASQEVACSDHDFRVQMSALEASSFFNDCVSKSSRFVEAFPQFSYSYPLWDDVLTCANFVFQKTLESCRNCPLIISEQCEWFSFKVIDAMKDPQIMEQCLALLGQQ